MRTPILIAAVVLLTAMFGGPACAGEPHQAPREGLAFAPADTTLQPGTPEQVGLNPEPLRQLDQQLRDWTQPAPDRPHPLFSGGVALLARDGVIVHRQAVGAQLRYADKQGTPLPADEIEPTQTDTIYDIASLTKLFTAVATLQQMEQGVLDLDTPVAHYLPEFGANGKERITVRQLLTHTSGLQAEVDVWQLPEDERIPHVLNLRPQQTPGSSYVYSDPNAIALGVLLEHVTGQGLDELIRQDITEPLGMEDTGFTPAEEKLPRIAATEFQTDPDRGLVRGEVHDENAWALGGIAGQAGMFSTADDLAVFAQSLVNGGIYGGERILTEETMRQMLTNQTAHLGEAQGLGFELNQPWYMGKLAGPHAGGHTGFTGTSLAFNPQTRSIAILLTNRVHPTREWGSINPARQAVGNALGD